MKLNQFPVTSAPEMFAAVRTLKAAGGTRPDHACEACRAAVLLRYGKHQNKYAICGRQGCRWCWSESWYASTESAWAAFERQQQRYLQEQASLESVRNTLHVHNHEKKGLFECSTSNH